MYVPQETPQELPEPETIQEQVVAAPEVEPLQTQEQLPLLEQYQADYQQQTEQVPVQEPPMEQQGQEGRESLYEQPVREKLIQREVQMTKRLASEKEGISIEQTVETLDKNANEVMDVGITGKEEEVDKLFDMEIKKKTHVENNDLINTKIKNSKESQN